MFEVWKDIPEYKGFYQASSLGRIKSLVRPFVKKERILSQAKDRNGYWLVTLSTKTLLGGKAVRKLVHRLIAQAFIPNPLNLEEINHIDCCASHNKPSNLEWVTRRGNSIHALKNRRIYGVKISYDVARLIRDEYLTGRYTQKVLAMRYGIGQDEVSRIINHKIWR